MSILDILRAKTPATGDALRKKLEALRNENPLAAIADLEAERRDALLQGKDDRVLAMDVEIKRRHLVAKSSSLRDTSGSIVRSRFTRLGTAPWRSCSVPTSGWYA